MLVADYFLIVFAFVCAVFMANFWIRAVLEWRNERNTMDVIVFGGGFLIGLTVLGMVLLLLGWKGH